MSLMSCSNCRRSIDSKFVKCPYCGTPTDKSNIREIDSELKASINKGVNNILKVLAIGFAGILVGILVLSLLFSNDIEAPRNNTSELSQKSYTLIPMSDNHENGRYFLISKVVENKVIKIKYLRKGVESDVYGKMEIRCQNNKIRKTSTDDEASLDSQDIGDWYTPTSNWTDNDIISFVCN